MIIYSILDKDKTVTKACGIIYPTEKGILMEEINLILKIQSVYNQFTRAEKKVADYCLKHREEVPYLSISELADACKVGDTSVYRFCRTLKLEGYQEFKMRFSLSQREGSASLESAEISDAGNKLAKKILLAHQNALTETLQLLNPTELQKTLDMLQQAQRVYFFGVGDSLLAAEEARNKFLRITPKVNCITDPHMQAVAASMTTERDLVFIISYSGATKDNLHIARLAKERGSMTACISHFQKSPLTAYCDAVLLCGSREDPLNRGSMSAKSAQLYLVDLLYQSYYEKNSEESSRNNELASASVVDFSL